MADDMTKYDRFELLMEHHRGLIRKLCWWRSSGNESLCDDLVQDCYLAMWEHFDSLRPVAAKLQEAAWVAWQCRSVFSHRDRKKGIPSVDETLFDYLPAPDASETREILDDLALALSPDEQIADRLGFTPRTVREKQRKLIEKLRQEHLNATKL